MIPLVGLDLRLELFEQLPSRAYDDIGAAVVLKRDDGRPGWLPPIFCGWRIHQHECLRLQFRGV